MTGPVRFFLLDVPGCWSALATDDAGLAALMAGSWREVDRLEYFVGLAQRTTPAQDPVHVVERIGAPRQTALSLLCRTYTSAGRPHDPCSGTTDEDRPRPCECSCHAERPHGP